MDRVSRVRPRQLPLRSPSARIGFPRSEEWFKPPGAIRRQGWSVDWDKCGAGPGCFHLIAGEVRGLARGDAAASGVSESPWDDNVRTRPQCPSEGAVARPRYITKAPPQNGWAKGPG